MRRLAAFLLTTTACGTYSHLRPADNLKAGGVELSAGLAASTVPEVVPVAQAAVGITSWMELEAQYEVYSALGELRFGILSTERNGVALAVGVGGGMASVWEDLGDDTFRDGAVLGDVVFGKRWTNVELYQAPTHHAFLALGEATAFLRFGL